MELKNRLFLVLVFSLAVSAFSAPVTEGERALEQGYDSYKNGEWQSSSIFLRKAVSYPESSTDTAWYMLIMSQMYSENYSGAVNDSNYFIVQFPDSSLMGAVLYQKGRALHFLGQNDSAVLVLSDFCHQYPESDMYSSALFWIGECFYEDYNFETAKSLFERVIVEYPSSVKAKDAQNRIDFILQREREEKLLYLLRMTGEEYLSSRENYERQMRFLKSEESADYRTSMSEAAERISELESEVPEVAAVREPGRKEIKPISHNLEKSSGASSVQSSPVDENSGHDPKYVKLQRKGKTTIDEEINSLRKKAELIQNKMNERTGAGANGGN